MSTSQAAAAATAADPAATPGWRAQSRVALAARAAGRHAALSGAPVTACPYRADAGPELVLALNWARGYRTVTPAPAGN